MNTILVPRYMIVTSSRSLLSDRSHEQTSSTLHPRSASLRVFLFCDICSVRFFPSANQNVLYIIYVNGHQKGPRTLFSSSLSASQSFHAILHSHHHHHLSSHSESTHFITGLDGAYPTNENTPLFQSEGGLHFYFFLSRLLKKKPQAISCAARCSGACCDLVCVRRKR